MFERILVGLDGSLISKTAFMRAMDFAAEDNCELHAITVVSSGRNDSAVQTKSEMDARALLESLETLAKERGLSLTVHLAAGNPGELIVSTAEKVGADLIVVGSLGKSHMERILLGSVSGYVTKNAGTNIIVIRN